MKSSPCVIMLVVVLFLPGCDKSSDIPEEPPGTSTLQVDADIIVIGAGVAGISVALEASSAGKKVLVLDMASIFGGHALMSAGGLSLVDTPMQREQGIVDSPELAFQEMLAWGGDIDQGWARRYTEASRTEVYDWVVEQGVNFAVIRKPMGNSVPRMHFPDTLGHGLMLPLIRHALQSSNIRFEFNLRADELILENNTVHGVRTTHMRSGEQGSFFGKAVVIATGGFQSNLDKVRHYWPGHLQQPELILAGSGVYSQGLGLELATNAGAGLHRMGYMWNYVTGIPDPHDPSGERGLRVHIEPGLPRPVIWLNAEGERFINECLSPKYTLPEISKQPGGNHWMLFDAKGRPLVSVAGSGWTPEKVQSEVFDNPDLVKTADSLAELADLMGVPANRLEATIGRYNEFLRRGQDEDFKRFGEDRDQRGGCAVTEAIDTPPFFAIKRYPLARKSMGGIAIDQAARVVDTSGKPIPNLYAAGEVTGFAGVNGTAGLEGTFLGPSIYTGRIAARTAVADMSDSKPVSWSIPEPDIASETEPSATKQECQTCHQIDALISASRSGFQHFERAHGRVVELSLPCASCHADLAPYNPAAHKIDYLELSNSCVVCHGLGGD